MRVIFIPAASAASHAQFKLKIRKKSPRMRTSTRARVQCWPRGKWGRPHHTHIWISATASLGAGKNIRKRGLSADRLSNLPSDNDLICNGITSFTERHGGRGSLVENFCIIVVERRRPARSLPEPPECVPARFSWIKALRRERDHAARTSGSSRSMFSAAARRRPAAEPCSAPCSHGSKRSRHRRRVPRRWASA